MAKATKKYSNLKINLELEPVEAEALYVVLMMVGGNESCSGRKFSQRILNSLQTIGYGTTANSKFFEPDRCILMFKDGSIASLEERVANHG